SQVPEQVFHDREGSTTENDIKAFAIMKNAARGAAGPPVIMKKSKPAHTKTSGYISTRTGHDDGPSSWPAARPSQPSGLP
ncbi:MAG: hypothetical protein ABSB59_43465, partial [Streptosporangiaceae bacterium]